MQSTRNRIVAAVGLLTAMVVGAVAYGVGASGAEKATPTAVAVVDLEKIFKGVKEFQQRELAAKNQMEANRSKLEGMVEEARQKSEALADLPADSPRRQTLMDEIRLLQANVQIETDNMARKSNEDLVKLFDDFYAKVLEATRTVAERDGWDVVMLDDRGLIVEVDPNKIAAPNLAKTILQDKRILYVNDRADITQTVINRMEALAGAGG